MDGEGKAYQVSSPPARDRAESHADQDAGGRAVGGRRRGTQGATASTKEAVRKGRIENSPDQGKKRTASEDPEVITSKRGKKSSSEGSAPENAPAESPPKGDPLSPEA